MNARFNIQSLGRMECVRLWESFEAGGNPIQAAQDRLTKDESDIRGGIQNAWRKMKEKKVKKEYDRDLRLALDLYCRILPMDGGRFPLRMASDDGIWRRLCMHVIPEIVADRWAEGGGLPSRTHFWSSPQRNWLKSLWWYIHLTWQGAEESTRQLLAQGTTDTIQQMVERPGTGGHRVDISRELVACLARKEMSEKRFRRLMKLHTAKVAVEPQLCESIRKYVEALWKAVK